MRFTGIGHSGVIVMEEINVLKVRKKERMRESKSGQLKACEA